MSTVEQSAILDITLNDKFAAMVTWTNLADLMHDLATVDSIKGNVVSVFNGPISNEIVFIQLKHMS
jgi:hypothetical protein